jgi:lipopolysaccharide transport system ATP-binding protein
MSDVVISVENISKEYRLGTVSHNTMRIDMESWWARMRGKEDPNNTVESLNC